MSRGVVSRFLKTFMQGVVGDYEVVAASAREYESTDAWISSQTKQTGLVAGGLGLIPIAGPLVGLLFWLRHLAHVWWGVSAHMAAKYNREVRPQEDLVAMFATLAGVGREELNRLLKQVDVKVGAFGIIMALAALPKDSLGAEVAKKIFRFIRKLLAKKLFKVIPVGALVAGVLAGAADAFAVHQLGRSAVWYYDGKFSEPEVRRAYP